MTVIRFTYFDTSNSNIPFSRIGRIEFDSKGNLWIGSANEGIAKYQNNYWTVYKDKIKWNNVYSLYIDDEDCVWVGGFELSLYKDGVWSYYEHDDSADHYLNIILDIEKDSHNNIWVNALYGIYKFDGNKWTKFDHTNSGLPDYSLGSLEFDQYDNLWIAGAGAGVILYKEGGVVTEINESISTSIISRLDLSQNYPNPFNPTTKIKYFIPSKAVMLNSFQHLNNSEIPKQVRDDEPLVILKIYDILGREVTTLVNQKQKPGNYEVIWDASKKPSGVYFYQLTQVIMLKQRRWFF